MEYLISSQNDSCILGKLPIEAGYSFMFYQISQQFFHRFKSMLDRALYQYINILSGAKTHCGDMAADVFKQRFKLLIIPKTLADIDIRQSTDKGRGARNRDKFDLSVQNGEAALNTSLDQSGQLPGTSNFTSRSHNPSLGGQMNIYDPQYVMIRPLSYHSFIDPSHPFARNNNNSVSQNGGGLPTTKSQPPINPQNQTSKTFTQNSGGFPTNMPQPSTLPDNQSTSMVGHIENNPPKTSGSWNSSATPPGQNVHNPYQSPNIQDQLVKRSFQSDSVSSQTIDLTKPKTTTVAKSKIEGEQQRQNNT